MSEPWQITREVLACPWCSDPIDTTALEIKWEQDIHQDELDGVFMAKLTCAKCVRQFDVEGEFFVEWKARRVRHLQSLPNPVDDDQVTGYDQHRRTD